ncbi:sigma-70 family RNA polymerase sigma factor [Streptomyces sp. NPDC060366]|uniref:sigma-70 family RNA polymerase sigma factor n=1 Tax=Streptomyces sp. NPDC060366 TaxID=3347105 RepID=UPI0036595245
MDADGQGLDDPDTTAGFRRLAELVDPAGPADGQERERLRAEVICAWLPMAYRLASRFRRRGEALEDLRQVAAVGLVKAVDRYDPDLGNAFASYAIPTITGEIKRHFRDRLWSVHVPRRVQELCNTVRVARAELSAEPLAGVPSDSDVAAHTGLSPEEVREGVGALHSFSALSTDAEVAGVVGGLRLGDTLGDVDTAFDLVVDRATSRSSGASTSYFRAPVAVPVLAATSCWSRVTVSRRSTGTEVARPPCRR